MSASRIYLDHNAGAPLRPEARACILRELARDGVLGNPSSAHTEGRHSRALLEDAREHLAAAVGCPRDAVIFTSGGTESNALALRAVPRGSAVAVGACEHPSILEPAAQRHQVKLIPIGPDGHVQLKQAPDSIALVSLSTANHETGHLQDMEAAAAWTHDRGGVLHSDGCQALGKVPLLFEHSGVDLLSLSAHKVGGPVGVGALIVRDSATLTPLLRGGGQEAGLRAGTEAALLAAAFAVATTAAVHEREALAARWRRWNAQLRTSIVGLDPTVVFHSADGDGLPNTLSVSFPGRRGPSLVHRLDLEGVAVSHGSACATGSLRPSPVLLAMGAGEAAAGSVLRISMGHDTSEDDVRGFSLALARTLAAVQPRAIPKKR